MSISGILGHHNLNGITVQIVPPDEVYDGLETLFTIRIHNGRRLLHSFLLEIVFQDHCSTYIPLLMRNETAKVNIPVTFKGRGEHIDHALTIRSNFPINFFIRSLTIQLRQTIIVFPQPLPCRSALSQYSDQAGQKNESIQKGDEGDITRIRDYQGGEPLKMVHWKLSARHDSLKIKELSATAVEPVEIDPHSLPGKTLESQLCCASFLINEFSRSNRPVGLKLGKTVHPAATGCH